MGCRVLVTLVALLALLASVHANQQQDFDSVLAAHAPELVEHDADSFLTLSAMGADMSPEQSFAEVDSSVEADESPAQPALVETSSKPVNPWHRADRNQPVSRNNAKITCLDGDCARATGVKKAKIGSHPNAKTKKRSKLGVALAAVKEEIMVRVKELDLEKAWAAKVTTLVDEYQQKLQKVTTNINSLRAQTKALLRKKKQIQNVQVQNKLRYKLQLAQADLNRLMKQMQHIAGKEHEFTDTEKQLKGTMNALKNSLLKLRGQEPKQLEVEGFTVV